MRRFIIGGNWKMQVTGVEDSVSRAQKIVKLEGFDKVDVFIAPSFTALYEVGKILQGTPLKLCGQNMHHFETGAFTGEVSVESLLEAGCEYVLLGHSERRRIFGETDELINKKVLKALEHKLKVVLAIGETAKEREEGRTAEVNRSQLAGSLAGVPKEQMDNIVIAYEPVWAINNKHLNPDTEIHPATPKQAVEAHQIVRNWVKEQYGEEVAESIRIQYGGSMKGSNAEELLTLPDIDGGLIGGASLTAEALEPIIKAAVKFTR